MHMILKIKRFLHRVLKRIKNYKINEDLMLPVVKKFIQLFFTPKNITIKNYQEDKEAAKYNGCSFSINDELIHFRTGKITPTKIGQFVTFWKRNTQGITEPYDTQDTFKNLIVYTPTPTQHGVFIFPKDILTKYDFISSNKNGGKRGFRLYPVWDTAKNNQAKKSQTWQLHYFHRLD